MRIAAQYRLRTVDIVIYPGFKAIEAVGSINVLDYANRHLAMHCRPPAYDVRIASTSIGPVQSDTLICLPATKKINPLAAPDIAIIVGARHIELSLKDSREVVEWVKSVAPRVSKLISLCSGSFFLAEAGVLDGKRATTHWSVSELLGSRYPAVIVEPDKIFTREGDVWTSAGVTASIDLALALVEEDLGRDVALAVARDMVVYLKRPGGQSQFSVHLTSQMTDHPTIRSVQDWILQHLAEKLTIPALAKRVATSTRNFTRMFSAATGHSPAAFIELARYEQARCLLEEAELPLKTIAARCGFTSDDQLRRVFQKRLGIPPLAYRERFSTTGVSSAATQADFPIG